MLIIFKLYCNKFKSSLTGPGLSILLFLTVLSNLGWVTALRADSPYYPDIRILQSSPQGIIIEWQAENFRLLPVGKDYMSPRFAHATFRSQTPGSPAIPLRKITFGVPAKGSISVRILSKEVQTYNNVQLAPVPQLFKDKKGINQEAYKIDERLYSRDAFVPLQDTELSETHRFRDIPIQWLYLTPVHFNPATRTLTLTRKMRLKITYHNLPAVSKTFRKQGKLDDLYEKMLLNFDQARHWQVIHSTKKLAKPASLPEGTWYKMEIGEDGLYKITPSMLESAGINMNQLGIDDIQMFNNGGHALNIKVNATDYNPLYTQNIPVLIRDLNQNGLFDGNDYLIFYGKGVDSWFYESALKDFSYQMNPYDTKNYYWLVINPGNGIRLIKNILDTQPDATPADYFTGRFHFEEDIYNLLASGPDWYGHRLFGRSDAMTQDFSLNPDMDIQSPARFKIQLKGGSGIKFGDDLPYRYYFTIRLNSHVMYSNVTFSRSTRSTYIKNDVPLSDLNKGKNTLSIQYTGNLDACNAYLDWFEIYYPHNFQAKENQLLFYTREYTQPKRYTIRGLGNADDYYVLDVTYPTRPVILMENQTVTNGTLTFDLPPAAHPQAILVSSLSSPAVKEITELKPVQHHSDILSTDNQADFLIITHKSFVPWAERLAERRSQLTHKIVTTDDIFMNFSSGMMDPTAIRNFIRYAYNNWQKPAPSYILFFGDAHYDYRNIILPDTMRVPSMEIYDSYEIDSRVTDSYLLDMDYHGSDSFGSLTPDFASGRIPIESTLDAERYLKKLASYEANLNHDGWQTVITLVADDNIKPNTQNEWMHQNQTETMARMSELAKFNLKKIYLSMYPSLPGGFGRVKPKANEDLINALNQGTLIVNYVGHGSPVKWAHEDVFDMDRDLDRIVNPGKLPFLIAATCDFAKFDDPHEPSFTEALIWQPETGIIGALASARLVFSTQNALFNQHFYFYLFPRGGPSIPLGEAKLLATGGGINDQKYFLLADPTMHLVDPRKEIRIISISPDTLKALSEVTIQGEALENGRLNPNFNGSAMMIINDASFDSVKTGKGFNPVKLPGPVLFKGELSVVNGIIKGSFIVPKSIRYVNKKSGRVTLYGWDEENTNTALGYNNRLLVNGSVSDISDSKGPDIDIYFKDQENFSNGDLVANHPILMADLEDVHGINITGEAGHSIYLQIDRQAPVDISGFFTYLKDSFKKGFIQYPLENLSAGEHALKLTAFDNLNNPAEDDTYFKVIRSDDQLVLEEVVNYPNPFPASTTFTFQTNREGADVAIKIYTISGRLIQELHGNTVKGYNDQITWDGLDRDGDEPANGVYLYKIVLKDGNSSTQKIDKLMIMR